MKSIRSGRVFVLVVLSLSAVAVLGLCDDASAVPVLIISRGALGETDFIDWGSLGPAGTLVASPFTISSNGGGNGATVSEASGQFKTVDQCGSGSCDPIKGWSGSFASGDHLLFTGGSNGPMTIQFSTPVAGAGAQIEANFLAPFVATLDVYDTSNTKTTFSLAGVTKQTTGDNSAIFLGARDTTVDISKIVYSTVSPGFTSENNAFAINRLSLTSNPAVVPEPSTLALLTSALPILAFGMRMRGKNRRIFPQA